MGRALSTVPRTVGRIAHLVMMLQRKTSPKAKTNAVTSCVDVDFACRNSMLTGNCRLRLLAEVMHKLSTDPMFHFLVKLGIGAAVGWIADSINPLRPGVYLNLLLGVTGALLGARVGEILEISRLGIVEPVAALLGSIFVLVGWRQIQSR
jgi:uncharacterized membrane protein YeaQ/YmgE (transglycosylase-associated protein family)